MFSAKKEEIVLRTIKQTMTFYVSPYEVFNALMDSKRHAAFTGAAAKISKKIGGNVMAYDGYITGKNIELIQDRKILQTWRASEWVEGQESTIQITLKKIKGGTKLSFCHRQVPEEYYASVKQGWIDFYWKPMKAYFKKIHQ
jgi:activator of HSP90 ATPase